MTGVMKMNIKNDNENHQNNESKRNKKIYKNNDKSYDDNNVMIIIALIGWIMLT